MRKHIPYPRRQFIRRVLKAGIAVAFGVLADIRINGRENLPKSGPLIVVGNHFHFLDPLMFVHLLPYPAEFIGGAKMPNAPAATHFLQRMFGVIPTARGTVSRDTLYGALHRRPDAGAEGRGVHSEVWVRDDLQGVGMCWRTSFKNENVR